MKKNLKWFIVGFVMACLMITPLVAFADAIQATLNSVNINVNGTQVAAKGQSYILDNGNSVPYSVNYNGTVYLPIRKVSELVGKDIAYDGKTSTISISDKAAGDKAADATVDTKTDNTKTDTTTKPSDKATDTGSKAQTKSGYAVINSFNNVQNTSGVVVNQVRGFLDGTNLDMLTSQKDMISYSDKTPTLYGIKYSNDIITSMSEVSVKVTDTVKSYSEPGSITGAGGTYELNSDYICYRLMRGDDGTIDSYKVSVGSSMNPGYKVYLFDTNSSKGYDVVVWEK